MRSVFWLEFSLVKSETCRCSSSPSTLRNTSSPGMIFVTVRGRIVIHFPVRTMLIRESVLWTFTLDFESAARMSGACIKRTRPTTARCRCHRLNDVVGWYHVRNRQICRHFTSIAGGQRKCRSITNQKRTFTSDGFRNSDITSRSMTFLEKRMKRSSTVPAWGTESPLHQGATTMNGSSTPLMAPSISHMDSPRGAARWPSVVERRSWQEPFMPLHLMFSTPQAWNSPQLAMAFLFTSHHKGRYRIASS